MHNNLARHTARHKVKGFTLIELMTVVVVIGIIAAIAFPAYTNSIKKSKRADAQGALMSLANAMERYYTTNGSYTGADPATLYADQVPVDGGTAYYNLSISVGGSGDTYTLTATATGSMSGDGNFTLTNTGVKKWKGSPGWDS